MKNITLKQMLEGQYSIAMRGLVECENDNLLLAQVCNNAMKDVNLSFGKSKDVDDLIKRGLLSNIYNEFFHYYAGTTYGKSEEVCKDVEIYSKDKTFLKKMLRHSIHYIDKMEKMAA